MTEKTKPVVIELEGDAKTPTPAQAPPVPDMEEPAADGRAMQTMAVMASGRSGVLGRLFLGSTLALVMAGVSVALWDFVFSLMARNIWLGRGVLALVGLFLLAALGLVLREWVALARLKRIDRLRGEARSALAQSDLTGARKLTAQLVKLYDKRPEMRWAIADFADHGNDMLDADALLHHAERSLMPPLDAAARREIEAAARQVATVTAIVPLALADVVVALVANLRMVRRIATIYGGRTGGLGSWRLLKTVMLHLAATGAVSVGDDMIGSIMGGGMVGKLSRRFGEGIVNGALTARVGLTAMELCRPLPFDAVKRPKVTAIVKSALAGLFG